MTFNLNIHILSSIDGDSDSLSEFRDISPMKSPMIDETATNISYKMNGFAQNSNVYSNQSSSNFMQNGVKQTTHRIESNGYYDGKENQNHTNGTDTSNGFHSSPLRSQLGLNLKSSTTTVKKSTNLLTVILCFFLFSRTKFCLKEFFFKKYVYFSIYFSVQFVHTHQKMQLFSKST